MLKGKQFYFRLSFVIVVFVFLWGLLLFRTAYLQLIPNQKLSHLQNKLFERTAVLKPRRGVIYDRRGKELAISIPSQSLFADPQRVKEPYYIAKKLSQLLGISKTHFLKRLLNKKRRFVWLKRHLNEKQIQKIKSWKLEGLYFIKESRRFYTHHSSLSQVLGFTGVDGQGLEGIEKQYDNVLRGEPQKILLQRDARGRPLFMDFSPFIEKVSGFDVYLTIDSDLQVYLEKELEQMIQKSFAKNGMGLILSAKTSEVLAMANIPNYNPNSPQQSPHFLRRNRTVTDMFEPGSTIKTFTLISALRKGIKANKLYSSQGGELKIGNSIIKEADPKKKFKPFLNMTEMLALSSNVGISSIALEVGAKNLRKTLDHFGFGHKTGIDFQGESPGMLRELPWRPVETATISFGHGIASTALQVANAYSSIANGGILRKPFLVRQIRNPYTGEEKNFKSQNLRKVLTPKEAKALTLMLISVTEEEGTGVRAGVSGYFVAGKTGTAQKVDLKNKGYKKGEYITSFAGFIPANDPKFVIYLVIDGAKDNFYSSSLTAPLFSRVASYSVRNAGISPTLLKEESVLVAGELADRNIASDSKKENQNRILKTKNNSIKSLNQMKQTKVNPNSLENQKRPAFVNRGLASSFVPNLKGLTLREALRSTQSLNLKVKIYGSGQVVRTIPSAGSTLPSNKQISLVFD